MHLMSLLEEHGEAQVGLLLRVLLLLFFRCPPHVGPLVLGREEGGRALLCRRRAAIQQQAARESKRESSEDCGAAAA